MSWNIPMPDPPTSEDFDAKNKSVQFFFPADETVIFKAEDKLFRVHRFFLERDSEFFRGLFLCPPEKGGAEGKTEDKPIVLADVTAFEFLCLLKFLYNGMYKDGRNREEWIALLTISNRFFFNKIRKLSIAALTKLIPPLDPVERIALANKCEIPEWNEPAYVDLCVRNVPITDAEAEIIGISTAFLLMKAREEYRRRTINGNITFSCGHEIPGLACLQCTDSGYGHIRRAADTIKVRENARHERSQAISIVKAVFQPPSQLGMR
ncbi:hypothetical protein OBBRIDRAFT_789134 [Obba rivulosa]|uniref:BTB domain-containing protein n=1 Tax=Obba rivulosa TaxID=1052685 RepID=A0A8E2DRU0_9APHY|nr:hypothetical protein OBBRIDRAFT_789134 [Obba rivulosa]